MLSITQEKFYKTVEWVLFVCLCIVSLFFMKEVLEKHFSKDTNFKQHEETISEHPTITICLPPFSVYDEVITIYNPGTDFNISIRFGT